MKQHMLFIIKKKIQKTTELKEFEAEMTAYIVAKRFGVDTSEHTIKYVSDWTESMSKLKILNNLLKQYQCILLELLMILKSK